MEPSVAAAAAAAARGVLSVGGNNNNNSVSGGISATAAALAVGGPSPVGTPAAVAVPLELVSSVPTHHHHQRTTTPSDATSQLAAGHTVYVDSSDLASVVSSCGSAGLQLTTITVAVPAPLSPNDPAFLAAAAAAGSLNPPPTAVALPTVPAPQQECSTLKWKYEQNNKEKTGTSLVRPRETKDKGFLLQNTHF